MALQKSNQDNGGSPESNTFFTAFIKDGNKWTNETFNSYGEHIETKNYSLETLLLADETQYKIDIDTDGFIGNRVIESYIESGEKSVYKVETGDYIMARMGALSGQHLIQGAVAQRWKSV